MENVLHTAYELVLILKGGLELYKSFREMIRTEKTRIDKP
jgi:hypothetical protein